MNKKIINLLLTLVAIVFVASYIISESGYYEYTMQERTIITNEKIKQFEQDVKDNKDIDLIEYLDDEIDYSNKFTKIVYNISDNSNKLARKLMKALFKKLGSLVED